MATLMQTVRKVRSPENKTVLQAVEELRVRGWLEDGSLLGVRLCHAKLEGADLLNADLRKIDFHQANLSNADLGGANLEEAKLKRADLRCADFSGAKLQGTDFLKANLAGARNLTEDQLAQAHRLCFATMPDGQPYNGRFNLPGDLELARWGRVDPDDPGAMAYFLGVPLKTYLQGQEARVKTIA